MIKKIAVDLGGVLFSEGKTVLAGELDKLGYDSDLVTKLLTSPKSLDLRRGILSDGDFWVWFQKQAPDYDATLIKNKWYQSYKINHDVEKILKLLRKDYPLIAFSGNIESRVEYLDEKYHFRKLFNQEIYSHQHGFSKPEKAFVEVLLKEAGVPPNQLLYIDDSVEHASAAIPLGVNTIVFSQQIPQLKADLKKHGIKL